jgi:octaprenyl-diphosphate synthase
MEEYFSIIEAKTASLFAASCRVGAILGKAPESHVKSLAEFGRNLGIAFQIIDDCLDFWGIEEQLGKPVGSDLRERNYTLPFIYLLKSSSENDKKRIMEILSLPEIAESLIEEILKIMETYRTKEHSYRVAEDFCSKALKNLSESPAGRAKDALEELIRFTFGRTR